MGYLTKAIIGDDPYMRLRVSACAAEQVLAQVQAMMPFARIGQPHPAVPLMAETTGKKSGLPATEGGH